MPEHAMQRSCIWQFIALSLNLKVGWDVAVFKEPPGRLLLANWYV